MGGTNENGKGGPRHGVVHGHHAGGGAAPQAHVRPHRHHLDEDLPPPDDDADPAPAHPHGHHHAHGNGAPVPRPADNASCAASNRRVMTALGSLAVHLADGPAGAAPALVAALLPRLKGTPAALIDARSEGGDLALPGLETQRAAAGGEVDAHAIGLAMDDMHLRPAAFLFILTDEGEVADLGADLRIDPGSDAAADPAALAHRLMAALAAKAR